MGGRWIDHTGVTTDSCVVVHLQLQAHMKDHTEVTVVQLYRAPGSNAILDNKVGLNWGSGDR